MGIGLGLCVSGKTGTLRSIKWDKGVTDQHNFDENLTEVSLITRDALEPTLPLSVVVHIDDRKAPLVVQRFGDIKKLVEQTRTLAKADADRVRFTGEGEATKMVALASAEAERITKTGMATAERIARQVEASGGARIQLTRQVIERLADALEKSGVDIVPRISIQTSGGEGGNPMGGGSMQALLGMLLTEKGGALLETLDTSSALIPAPAPAPAEAGEGAKLPSKGEKRA